MIPYEIIYSARKTIALQVKDQKVIVRAPYFTSKKRIEAFLLREENWIRKTLQKQRVRPVFPDDPETISDLKKKAAEILPGKTAYYAEKMGLTPQKVSIGQARTRFGACSSKGSIVFSCFLMLYPDEAIDSVVVHELAHLRYMNHGKNFYALVEKTLPDYKRRIRILKG